MSDDFRELLKRRLPPGVTVEELDQSLEHLRSAMIEEIKERPPTIGMVGVSGVGKSSTINRFFKANLPVSDIVATTKEFRNVDLQLQPTRQESITTLPIPQEIFKFPVHLRVVDAPGLGEDISRDPDYLQMYHEHLPQCDVILWIIAARNRAMALDQQYLREFAEFYPRMAFGMNQVDLLEPMDWNHVINLPHDTFEKVINTAADDRKKKLEDIVQKPVKLIPYSSKYGYNLDDLFSELLEVSHETRGWMFGVLKNFQWDDFIPKYALEALARNEVRRAKFRRPFKFLRLSGRDRGEE